ncbi:MAG: MoaD/ThiS family protein [Gammaproteobacteria bacterium]|nr:MoaD/ThiS family protein [Gammaproteobacteria bacterium]
MIRVKFFASLREQFGAAELDLPTRPGMSVAEVWNAAAGQPLPDYVLMARNLEYVQSDSVVEDGDEIAFFPPVTGG